MHFVYTIFEWLLILAFIGFIGVIIWIVMAALDLKNSVMSNAKRLYVRPVNSVKSLIGTGKGIALREGVRFKNMAGEVKTAAAAVRVTAEEVKTAGAGIQVSDLKAVLSNIQNVVKFLSAVTKVTRSAAAKQGAAS